MATSNTYSPCSACQKLNRIPTQSSGQPVCGSCKGSLPIHDGVNALSASELQLLIEKSPVPVLADFWAPWCGPCKVLAPIIQQAAQKGLVGQVVIAKVDVQEFPLAGNTYSIRGVPTLILFQGGSEKQRITGALSYSGLLQWIQSSLPQGSSSAAA